MGALGELFAIIGRILRSPPGLVIVALAIVWLVVRRVRARRRAAGGSAAAGKFATEVRCERHGIRLRLEADTQASFDDARFHVQCPLCAIARSREINP